MTHLATLWTLPPTPAKFSQARLIHSFTSCLTRGINLEADLLVEAASLNEELSKLSTDKTMDLVNTRITLTQVKLRKLFALMAELHNARIDLLSKLHDIK